MVKKILETDIQGNKGLKTLLERRISFKYTIGNAKGKKLLSGRHRNSSEIISVYTYMSILSLRLPVRVSL